MFPSAMPSMSADIHVVLTVTIDAAGHVEDAVLAQSGGQAFDDAALDAVKRWTFVPPTKDGKPIQSKIHVPFVFHPPAEQSFSVGPSPSASMSVAVSSSTSPSAFLLNPAASASSSESPALVVQVKGDRSAPSRGASVFSLPVHAYSDVPRKNSTALLTLAPGIFLTNEGGDGHAEQVFLRGFDAREG
jgi:TonB family protein